MIMSVNIKGITVFLKQNICAGCGYFFLIHSYSTMAENEYLCYIKDLCIFGINLEDLHSTY